MRAKTSLALACLMLAAGVVSVADARTPSQYDEEHPIYFVGTQPAVLNGRVVSLIGMAPDYIRILYNKKKETVPNEKIESLQLRNAHWMYDPNRMTFDDVIMEIGKQPDYGEVFGAVGDTEEIRDQLASWQNGGPAAEPDPPPAGGPPVADNKERPLPPPPVAKSVPKPSAVPAVTEPAAGEPPAGFDPKNVPDWVKYLSAAAVVIFLIKFFRN